MRMNHIKNIISGGLLLILASCTRDITLTQGMTTQQVRNKIGGPTRIEKNYSGGESWLVEVYRETHNSTYTQSTFERSEGESFYDYADRGETTGFSAQIGSSTTYERRDKRIDFDLSGHLSRGYKDKFVVHN